jgi:hypothetical protein
MRVRLMRIARLPKNGFNNTFRMYYMYLFSTATIVG